MKRLAFDLDGTILHEMPVCDRYFATCIERVRSVIIKAKEAGHFVVIYTARPWSDYRITEAWLKTNSIPYDLLLCGKYNFDILLDDRATNSIEEMEQYLDKQEK